jgi:hypothetical protein
VAETPVGRPAVPAMQPVPEQIEAGPPQWWTERRPGSAD